MEAPLEVTEAFHMRYNLSTLNAWHKNSHPPELHQARDEMTTTCESIIDYWDSPMQRKKLVNFIISCNQHMISGGRLLSYMEDLNIFYIELRNFSVFSIFAICF